MQKESQYERTGSRERMKELLPLAGFTVLAAVVATVVMDIIIYPVAAFAINFKNAFNLFIKYTTWIVIVIFIVYIVSRRAYRLKKDGFSAGNIVRYLLKRPLYYLAIFLFLVAASAVIISLIYVILGNNYYLLYKISNSI